MTKIEFEEAVGSKRRMRVEVEREAFNEREDNGGGGQAPQGIFFILVCFITLILFSIYLIFNGN